MKQLLAPFLLLLAAIATADPVLLTEREARATADRCLREQRWDEAIAAFAQTHKALPTDCYHAARWDPRSRIVQEVIENILRELDERHAPDADKLPYWDFFVRHYPFFSTDPEALEGDHVQPWFHCFRLAAEARMRAADPAGNEPRFAPCRTLAALRDDQGEEALAVLKGSTAQPHEDFGWCAFHAYRILRASHLEWSECSSCFPDSPLKGLAALESGSAREALESLRDPVARRWCLLESARDYNAEYEGEYRLTPEQLQELSSRQAPWDPDGLLEVWLASGRMTQLADQPEPMAAAKTRLEELWRRRPNSLAAQVARYVAFWPGSDPQLHNLHDADSPELEAWRKESPADPFLAWGFVQILAHRSIFDSGRLLSDAERARVEEIAARFATEGIRPFAMNLLAEDDTRHGRGERALARYREVLRFDPGAVRLPGPRHASEAIGEAREQLMLYAEIREPATLSALLPAPGADAPVIESWWCGTAQFGASADFSRRRAELYLQIGKPDLALTILQDGISVVDPDSALRFTDLALQLGREDSVEEGLRRVVEHIEKSEHSGFPEEWKSLRAGMEALRDYRKRLKAEGTKWILAELNSACDPDQAKTWRIPALCYVLRDRRDLGVEPAQLRPRPATMASILLACAARDRPSVNYLLDAYLDYQGDRTMRRLMEEYFPFDAEGVLDEIVARMNREGVGLWSDYLILGRRLGTPVLWRGAGRCLDHPNPAIRDWAKMLRTYLRRERPWLVFCTEGK